MELGASIEILDLRHFSASNLRPVLDAESELWSSRLHWDYKISSRLLMQYLDNHMLPGYAALDGSQVAGFVFCVYEETKAIIGDVFAPAGPARSEAAAHAIEETLLRHLLELLLNSPQVDRVESQLLIRTSGAHSTIFRDAGFDIYRRLFLVQDLTESLAQNLVQNLQGNSTPPHVNLPPNLQLRPWSDDDLAPAARLISAAYAGHTDSLINDQYRSIHGSMRFLNNIVRYSGCGTFSPQASHVIVDRGTRELAALVLGSRVSSRSGHITQVCVHPEFRRRGLARMLLSLVSYWFTRQGASEISLTVTEANRDAIDLYLSKGYVRAHSFDAAVWQRQPRIGPEDTEKIDLIRKPSVSRF
jgi:ribosomal protein S18 acetylase RimI-like enzyme